MTNEQQQLTTLLLNLLPADHTTVGNSTLLERFLAAAQAEGHKPPATEDDFKTAREALVAAGLAVKGKGRGGATARATGAQRPDFALGAPTPPAPAPARCGNRSRANPADGLFQWRKRSVPRRADNGNGEPRFRHSRLPQADGLPEGGTDQIRLDLPGTGF